MNILCKFKDLHTSFSSLSFCFFSPFCTFFSPPLLTQLKFSYLCFHALLTYLSTPFSLPTVSSLTQLSQKTTFFLLQFPPSLSKTISPLYCSMKLGRLCSSLKLGNRWVISLPVGFCCRLNCVFVPINLIKSLIAFANHPASSCCCLLLPLISEITGPLLEHKATDNSNACGRVGGGGL